MSLLDILYDQVKKEEKERDPMRLFISDLGKCIRQVQYRLTGAAKDMKADDTHRAETVMFSLADYIEFTLAEAFKERGELVEYQCDIDMPDRVNWGGRLDLIADYNGVRIIEVKTTRSNAFMYELLKPEHEFQAWCYHHYMAQVMSLTEYPILAYFDRGGSNQPEEFIVTPKPIVAMMDELDLYRDYIEMGVWHDQMPKVLKVRNRGKEIKYEPHHFCGYCDYKGRCRPDMGVETWASRPSSRDVWVPTKKAGLEALEKFTNTLIEEAM